MNALWLAAGSEAAKGEAAKSGPWGFAIILVLAVACYFLFKSMSRHMKYVREHPPTEMGGVAGPGTAAGAADACGSMAPQRPQHPPDRHRSSAAPARATASPPHP